MQQYFIDKKLNKTDIIYFDVEQSHHIKNVLRMKDDDVVKVVDINQQGFLVSLHIDNEVTATILEQLPQKVPNVAITLIQGVMKGERFEFLIQKASELGVTNIIPMFSKRSVVKENDKMDKKLVRYNKIALEACEQAKRDQKVSVDKPIQLKNLDAIEADLKLVAYEKANVSSKLLKDVLKDNQGIKSIAVVIGCEGGFDDSEIELLESYGFLQVSLGNNILRAETAGMAVVSNIMYEFE